MKLVRVKVLFIICISFLGRQSTHFGLMALEAGSLKPRCQEDQAPSRRFGGEDPFLPVCSSDHPSCCGRTTPVSTLTFHGALPVCFCVFPWPSSYKETRHTGLKTLSAPVWPHTGLTLQLQWPYFQIKSHPGVLGVRTSTPAVFVFCIWGEDSLYCILEGIQSDL